jgi:ABC-type sugar transport system ATPase subunit
MCHTNTHDSVFKVSLFLTEDRKGQGLITKMSASDTHIVLANLKKS